MEGKDGKSGVPNAQLGVKRHGEVGGHFGPKHSGCISKLRRMLSDTKCWTNALGLSRVAVSLSFLALPHSYALVGAGS